MSNESSLQDGAESRRIVTPSTKGHLHILGICGTFMGGIAALAKALGYRVTGSDKNVYPPMSTQLEKLGIALHQDDDLTQLEPAPDQVIIGNALSRGHPLVEAVLQSRIPYISGPQWLGETLLRQKHVLAIAGTHGKTTTASMLTWILEQAGKSPSFLIGGVVQPFGQTARLTDSDYFVIEADEYDTAFFDKRSKFLHYFADTFVVNNLEFDHADIFADLAAIQQQFKYALRTVPQDGHVLYPIDEPAVAPVVASASWVECQGVGPGAAWDFELNADDGSHFHIIQNGERVAQVQWSLIGVHNVRNALMAIAAAASVGVLPQVAAQALASFEAPARRLQLRGQGCGVAVFDDFAHHPTAIRTTLEAMRARVGSRRVVAIFEPRSNTMKAGVHAQTLGPAFREADAIYALQPDGVDWPLAAQLEASGKPVYVCASVAALVECLFANEAPYLGAQDASIANHWVVMSNGGFGGIHDQLLNGIMANDPVPTDR